MVRVCNACCTSFHKVSTPFHRAFLQKWPKNRIFKKKSDKKHIISLVLGNPPILKRVLPPQPLRRHEASQFSLGSFTDFSCTCGQWPSGSETQTSQQLQIYFFGCFLVDLWSQHDHQQRLPGNSDLQLNNTAPLRPLTSLVFLASKN